MTKGMWKPSKNVSESAIAFKIQNLGSQKTKKFEIHQLKTRSGDEGLCSFPE